MATKNASGHQGEVKDPEHDGRLKGHKGGEAAKAHAEGSHKDESGHAGTHKAGTKAQRRTPGMTPRRSRPGAKAPPKPRPPKPKPQRARVPRAKAPTPRLPTRRDGRRRAEVARIYGRPGQRAPPHQGLHGKPQGRLKARGPAEADDEGRPRGAGLHRLSGPAPCAAVPAALVPARSLRGCPTLPNRPKPLHVPAPEEDQPRRPGLFRGLDTPSS